MKTTHVPERGCHNCNHHNMNHKVCDINTICHLGTEWEAIPDPLAVFKQTEQPTPMADIDSIMEWLNNRGIEGDTTLFSTRAIAMLIQGFMAQWVLPVPNTGLTDDLKQYMTNLLYAAYDKGKEPISPIVFDLDVEEWIDGIDGYFRSL